MSRPDDETYVVTSAAPSPVEERHARERRYLITMGVRVIAFIAAIVFARQGWWLAAAVAIALSLILPWIAVVAANAPKRTRAGGNPALYRGKGRRELEGRDRPS